MGSRFTGGSTILLSPSNGERAEVVVLRVDAYAAPSISAMCSLQVDSNTVDTLRAQGHSPFTQAVAFGSRQSVEFLLNRFPEVDVNITAAAGRVRPFVLWQIRAERVLKFEVAFSTMTLRDPLAELKHRCEAVLLPVPRGGWLCGYLWIRVQQRLQNHCRGRCVCAAGCQNQCQSRTSTV